MKNKIGLYVLSGILLTYYGLKDEEFVILYNGLALGLGILAFIMAFVEYNRIKKEKE